MKKNSVDSSVAAGGSLRDPPQPRREAPGPQRRDHGAYEPPPHHWALVLAAGEGTRLSELTRDRSGQPVPKQFCSLNGGPTLLDHALARAGKIAPRERTVVVVAADQQRHWQAPLSRLPVRNIVVQPRNRGTAIGILLPVLRILMRDPGARIACLPSDHFAADENILTNALQLALGDLDAASAGFTFLGIEPDEADSGLGYIMPAGHRRGGSRAILRFVEKPERSVARRLIESGSLWNSFIFAATGRAIVQLIEARYLGVVRELQAALTRSDALTELERIYQELPVIDFSKDVVEGAERFLRVRAVPACGWSDLGTPQRLGECLQRFSLHALRAEVGETISTAVSLAEAYRRSRMSPGLSVAV